MAKRKIKEYDAASNEFTQVEGDGTVRVDVVEEWGVEQALVVLGLREVEGDEKADVSLHVPTAKGKSEKKGFVMSNNHANRPFSPSLAKQYSEAFLKGDWSGQKGNKSRTGNGETMGIDWNGQIVSAVHRNVGLVMADYERQNNPEVVSEMYGRNPKQAITIPAIVVSKLDPASADTADTGKNRSLGDILFRRNEFSGKEYTPRQKSTLSRDLAISARLVWLRVNGRIVARGPKFFHPDALQFVENHPALKRWTEFVYNEDGGNFKGLGLSRGYAAALAYLFEHCESDADSPPEEGTQKEKVEEFVTLLATGENLGKKHPVLSLRSLLIANAGNKTNPLDRDALCTVVCKAWLAFIEGKEVTPAKLKPTQKEGEEPVRVGGIDRVWEEEEEEVVEPVEETVEAA